MTVCCQMVALFGKTVELLGDWALLENVSHQVASL